MDSILTRHDNLMPQRTGGMRKGTVMALVVHVGLIVALAFGVSWRSQTPSSVSAELWSAVPQVAAPPPVPEVKPTPTPAPPPPQVKAEEPPPKPVPNEAQIAIEKERVERKQREQRELQERERREQQQRREQERLEREKADKLAAQKQRELEAKRQKEEEARQAKVREDNLKRMLSQATGTGTPNSLGTAARDSGPSSSYAGRIVARVKPNIVFADEVTGNPAAIVELRCASDGAIVGRRLVKSSGNKEWDDAVLRAIDRTDGLPRDTDGRVPPSIEITFRPRE